MRDDTYNCFHNRMDNAEESLAVKPVISFPSVFDMVLVWNIYLCMYFFNVMVSFASV